MGIILYPWVCRYVATLWLSFDGSRDSPMIPTVLYFVRISSIRFLLMLFFASRWVVMLRVTYCGLNT